MKCRNLPDLHELSKNLKRPVCMLHVLTPQNDPFHWTPAKIRNAEWFAGLWRQHGRPGLHPHGFHYILISRPHGEITLPSTGEPYENTTSKRLNPQAGQVELITPQREV